jgi:hypothetical protein
MKFKLDRPWPVGQHLLSQGTVIDMSLDDDYSRLVEGKAIPSAVVPLPNTLADALGGLGCWE